MNDPKLHYRATACELAQQRYMHDLSMALVHFSHSVQQVIPQVRCMEMPAFISLEDYVVSDKDMLEGRGPRFVAKYHLCRDDEQRAELLTSLPKWQRNNRGLDLSVLTADYRGSGETFHVSKESPEFTSWMNRRDSNQDYVIFDESHDLLDLVGTVLQYKDKGIDLVEIVPSFTNVKFTPPPKVERTHGQSTAVTKTFPTEHLIILSVPEMMGFAVFEVVHMAFGGDRRPSGRYIPRVRSVILWNQHELCWNIVHQDNIHVDYEEIVKRRFLEKLGMPELTLVSEAEKAETYQRLLTFVISKRSEWFDDVYMRGPTETRTISLPNVLQLKFHRGDNYYDDLKDTLTTLDDSDRGVIEIPIAPHFSGIEKSAYHNFKDNGSYKNGGPAISPYQDRRLIDLINQFLDTPEDQYVIEVKPRTSPD